MDASLARVCKSAGERRAASGEGSREERRTRRDRPPACLPAFCRRWRCVVGDAQSAHYSAARNSRHERSVRSTVAAAAAPARRARWPATSSSGFFGLTSQQCVEVYQRQRQPAPLASLATEFSRAHCTCALARWRRNERNPRETAATRASCERTGSAGARSHTLAAADVASPLHCWSSSSSCERERLSSFVAATCRRLCFHHSQARPRSGAG